MPVHFRPKLKKDFGNLLCKQYWMAKSKVKPPNFLA